MIDDLSRLEEWATDPAHDYFNPTGEIQGLIDEVRRLRAEVARIPNDVWILMDESPDGI